MKSILLSLALAAALGGCASAGPQVEDPKLELYRAHSGEPVDSFNYFGRINGWTPLGDEALVVWTRPTEAFLLELFGPCRDLTFAPAISLSNQMSRVSARFDSVIPLGGGVGPINIPCRIETIRPLQVKALKEAQRELREARMVERKQQAD